MKSLIRLNLSVLAFVFCVSPVAWAEEGGAGDSVTEIAVSLSEMKFTIDGFKTGTPLVLRAGGKYKITFRNVGQTLHEVLFGRGHVMEDGEMNYAEHMLASVEMDITGNPAQGFFEIEATGIKEIELAPGMKIAIEFTVPESVRGAWELGCFAPGHHQTGMHLPISVE
jgi:uncharacterized cupredoxin-like copper-binding protein